MSVCGLIVFAYFLLPPLNTDGLFEAAAHRDVATINYRSGVYRNSFHGDASILAVKPCNLAVLSCAQWNRKLFTSIYFFDFPLTVLVKLLN